MSLLGTFALIDATWAVIGEDSLQDVLSVLTPLLGDALPELEGQVVAEALCGPSPIITGARCPATTRCWSASPARVRATLFKISSRPGW